MPWAWVLLSLSLFPVAEPATAADERLLHDANVPTDGASLVDFFRRRTLRDTDTRRLRQLITDLGDDSFDVREKASAELIARGAPAEPLLRQALHDSDPEVVHRAQKCLQEIKSGGGAAIPAAAARLIARRRPPGATEALLAYLPSAENDLVADEVRQALADLAARDRASVPVLRAALGGKDAVRRVAAALALWKTDRPEPRAAVRKLLSDADLIVRLRVGLLVAADRQKDAIPVLIDLLGELPQTQGWEVVDFLCGLAPDQAPEATPGDDFASRKKCRDAWAAWWAKNGPTTDLARASKDTQPLGYTIVVLLDRGRVQEVDRAGKVRWQVEGLQFPLDVQWIPGGRILVAEQPVHRVSERNRKGEIVWQKNVPNPLVAQRLPNGHTFIATYDHLLEVDRTGKEVFSFPVGGQRVMRAQKLANGDMAYVVMGNGTPEYVRLDARGKELKRFPANVQTSGGRIDVQPNGRVLVPQMAENKVTEYDAQGKAVWEANVDSPIAAVRLANGHTLVTSMNQKRAVELDRAGKEVWEFRDATRVTRALRR